MKDPRVGLLSPLNFAAYAAWAAIGYELAFTPVAAPAWRDAAAPVWLLATLHVAFLALFLAVTSRDQAKPGPARVLVVGQIALTFVLVALARASAMPILLILCAIQIVYLWSPRVSAALIVAINIVMYLLYRHAWEVGAPVVSTVLNASFQAFAALTAWFAIDAERALSASACGCRASCTTSPATS